MTKKLIVLTIAFILVVPAFALTISPALAEPVTGWGTESGSTQEDVGTAIGLGDKDPRAIAASVINVVLGFLGIVAVIIILIGGFKWMTAAGNEDKVEEAKKLISAGIIGLVIILAAFGISKFVINALLGATGAVQQ